MNDFNLDPRFLPRPALTQARYYCVKQMATVGAKDVDPIELAQSAAVEKDIHSERARGVSQPDPAQPPAPAPIAPADPAPSAAPAAASTPVQPSAPAAPHSTAELIESQQGRTADAPLCLTCGTKMRPAGSCYVCEGCGSTSGCS